MSTAAGVCSGLGNCKKKVSTALFAGHLYVKRISSTLVLFTERWSEERLGSVHSFDLDWQVGMDTLNRVLGIGLAEIGLTFADRTEKFGYATVCKKILADGIHQ